MGKIKSCAHVPHDHLMHACCIQAQDVIRVNIADHACEIFHNRISMRSIFTSVVKGRQPSTQMYRVRCQCIRRRMQWIPMPVSLPLDEMSVLALAA